MTTKRRFRNKYRLELRERDHGSAHVHLVGGDVDIMIDLDTLESGGAWPYGLKMEVIAWIVQHRDELVEEWQKWHP